MAINSLLVSMPGQHSSWEPFRFDVNFFSFWCSCFRSCGTGTSTTVYGKWCFVLHLWRQSAVLWNLHL